MEYFLKIVIRRNVCSRIPLLILKITYLKFPAAGGIKAKVQPIPFLHFIFSSFFPFRYYCCHSLVLYERVKRIKVGQLKMSHTLCIIQVERGKTGSD